MCAYFYIQLYQAKKFTQTIEKSKYGDSGAFQRHYIAQINTQLKDRFYCQIRKEDRKVAYQQKRVY